MLIGLEGGVDNIHGLALGYQRSHCLKSHILLPENLLSNLCWKIPENLEFDMLHLVHVTEFGEIGEDLHPSNVD